MRNCEFFSLFDDGDQLDAQEFLSSIIAALHTELIQPSHVHVFSGFDGQSNQSALQVARQTWVDWPTGNTSMMQTVLGGQWELTKSCNICGHSTSKFDP